MDHIFDIEVGEGIVIGNDTVVIITSARTTQVKLGIIGPQRVERAEAPTSATPSPDAS